MADSSNSRQARTVARLRPFASTIFAEMTSLAVEHGAINLGQGFPDTDGPSEMLEVARRAIADGVNQYPPGSGMPALRTAIAADRSARYGLHHDPDTEVLVTVGATRRTVPLTRSGSGFVLDVDALRSAVTDRTRMLVVNTPHNPTGTVYDDDALAAIAELACERDLLVLSDEVYEHLVFDGRHHTPVASLPGMAERTITVSSAAKTFNVTGWKIGWAIGPRALIDGVRAAKQFMTFVGGAPFQPAVAHALTHEQPWVASMREDLQRKRTLLSGALVEAGFDVLDSAGTYFVCADITPLGFRDGVSFCRSLPEKVGVAAVPVSVFVDDTPAWNHLVRFAFCKRDDVLAEAVRRLHGIGEEL